MSDEARYVLVGQRRVMLVAVALLRQTFRYAFDRVFAAAMTGSLGPVEHRADALTHPSGGLGLR